jgi:outer membrane cobalamin receptor
LKSCYDCSLIIANYPALVLILLAGSAWAQQKSPPEATDPFFIKTTVSPVSARVTTSAEAQARNVQVADEAVNLTEGVLASSTKGPADTLARLQMRGFNGQSRNLVLLDGQPLNDAYNGDAGLTTIPVSEIDRIEVARGPFSSLYGGNAMGGVVNILTRPVSRRELESGVQYGSHNWLTFVRAPTRLQPRQLRSPEVQALSATGAAGHGTPMLNGVGRDPATTALSSGRRRGTMAPPALSS